MADDGADEVKVFRGSNDAEDLDTTAQSSQQLAQDKKEVALETELEQKTINGIKSAFEAKAAASPSFAGLPFGALPPFSPSYGAFPTMFMGMPWLMNPMQPRMSPSFMPFMPAALSPSFGLQQLMMNGPASPLYGAMAGAAAKCGVPLPASMRTANGGVNPLNQINQMRLPYQNAMAHLAGGLSEASETRKMKSERRAKEDHIKKPLNAFMWYMKENRPKLLEELEYKEKQSAELNKELGRRWHALNKEEQQRYFDLAKADREEHRQKYPHWSAKENYRLHKKKKRNREKSVEETEVKKCRARFGMERTDLWCKFCKRKKKCEVFLRDRPDSVTSHGSSIGLDKALTPHRPGSSHVAPLEFGVEHRMVGAGGSPTDDASDSESDIDDEVDDPSTLAALQEVAMQQESLMTL